MSNLRLDQLRIPVRLSDTRHTVFDLADGRPFVVESAPAATSHTEHARGVVWGALTALDDLEAARREIAGDQTLTDLGKAEKLAGLRQEIERRVAQAREAAETYAANVNSFESKVYAAPVIDRTDAVTVAEDIELRSLIRSMGSKERAELLGSIVGQPRMMEAVLRSPVPMPVLTEAIQRSWRDHVTATHPDAPQVTENRAAAVWALNTIPNIEAAVGITAARGPTERAAA